MLPLTENGRILNDYGVPYKVVNYYEKGDFSIKKDFDKYEAYMDSKIIKIVESICKAIY